MTKPMTVEFLHKRRALILADLLGKVEADDFHGVQDCASDIREIDAMLSVMNGAAMANVEPTRYDIQTDQLLKYAK